MEIQKLILKFRYHILDALLLVSTIFTILFFAPRFLTVLDYFWPLFFSTSLFLAVIFLFVKDSASYPTDNFILKPTKELLNYVAADHLPEPPLDNHNNTD
ncbi:uncharacterized protein LOC133310578 [Gastrolobium bilobum]|uniref:uncharacterized protein LOC133310578 n=1 Tax=Gastrolobium bilobum TaxID=150636 RepID=UPI002AB2D940|nr:uncharacterized protein LOC133310578 [Gastrolobium bilobum]